MALRMPARRGVIGRVTGGLGYRFFKASAVFRLRYLSTIYCGTGLTSAFLDVPCL